MITNITETQISELTPFLQEIAAEQLPFLTGSYFRHGENFAFGWYEKGRLVGCIRYCKQVVGQEQKTPPLTIDGVELTEAKINAFAVHPDFRNKGIGKKLQLEVIQHAKGEGCYQVASYSTFDKKENYAVKLALGFSVQSEIQPDGTKGCYFLMRI